MFSFLFKNKIAIAGFTLILFFLGGIYFGHSYTKNSYEAQIARKEAIAKQEAINSQAKAQESVASFISNARKEQIKSSSYQADARLAFNDSSNSSFCLLPYGFIRLFNASATGDQTAQSSTDNITSSVDIATLLSVIIENHGKYREAARQIEAMQQDE